MLVLAVPVVLFVIGALLVPTLLFAIPVLDALLVICGLAYPIGVALLVVSIFKAIKFPGTHHYRPWMIAGLAIIAIHLLTFC